MYYALLIAVALICLLAGIIIGGILVLLLDTKLEERLISRQKFLLEPDGEIPPIGWEQ